MEKIGVIICGHDETAHLLGDLARSLLSSDLHIVIGYDANNIIPTSETIHACDYFYTGGSHIGKLNGELRSIRLGLKYLIGQNCKYTLKLTGDAIIKHPENICNLIDELGGNDLICSQWNDISGTMVFFGYTYSLYRIFVDIPEGWPQLEKRFSQSIKRNNIKAKICDCYIDNRGIWDMIGYGRINGNYPEQRES